MQLATFSKGIAKTPYLLALLHARGIVLSPSAHQAAEIDLVIGWGRKPNTKRAIKFAQRHDIPYTSLEDGFLRSVGLGRAGESSISLVVDQTGIYYDASQPSSLEELLNDTDDIFTPSLMHTADQAITFILKHKISKYNGAPDMPTDRCLPSKKNVLIIDQVAGDASVTYGAAAFSLEKMINAAKDENPNSDIYIKLHPETIQGFRKGLFSGYTKDAQIQFITEDYNPLSVLEKMDKVYVATSQMGFEALIMGKDVVCFGIPFYAGWGLTDDRERCSRRIEKHSVEELFVAAYILYSRYVNPVTGKRCDILKALEYLELQTKLKSKPHLVE
jgi:capsular polysaccharide export protein